MSSKHHDPHETPKQQTAGAPASGSASGPAVGSASGPAAEAPSLNTGDPGAGLGAAAVSETPGREVELEAEVRTLAAETAALREELSQVNDKYLRKLADDANFRKRMAREKEEGQRFAVASLLVDLIPILDDFDRAVASAETVRDYTMLHDGIILIRRQLGTMLENKYGLKRLESLGKAFDPNQHEAVAMTTGETEDAIVAEEFVPGYGLHERILRTAKVKVLMPAPRTENSAAGPVDPDANDSSGAEATPTNVED
ncbi:MAG TPA: nucleotide exchange factor GrpE [Rectinemataceae bacterium]|nr:nucleotide exchange factor GrpE [Rectinemataceae bacterium]